MNGGCVPPCPDALARIENDRKYQKFREEARAPTLSTVMTQPGTDEAALQGSHG